MSGSYRIAGEVLRVDDDGTALDFEVAVAGTLLVRVTYDLRGTRVRSDVPDEIGRRAVMAVRDWLIRHIGEPGERFENVPAEPDGIAPVSPTG
ncbi:MAG: hypothetical protein CMN30_27695 [Sandaracinus sp.]|nr:hypothetical protein [Sandaracinus sp.]|tara:strand:- start:101 stop:379 length:279 start_codon:yes stop_codon:yes gene_type:complete